MKTKFIKMKRIVIPMLVAVAVIAQTTVSAFALSTEGVSDLIGEDESIVMEVGEVDAISAAAPISRAATSFTDLSEVSWAVDAINDMASRGIIQGVGNNKFAPKDNVTRQEFAAMAIRAFGGENKVNELAQQMSAKAEAEGGSLSSLKDCETAYGNNWSNEVMVASQYFPEIAQAWSCRLSDWSKDANRAEMAFIVMTIAESLGDEKFEITDGINTVIGDFNEVSGSPYVSSITKAYSNGILVGTNDAGDYKPNEYPNRAEAATIMQRLVDSSKRKAVEVNIEPEEVEGTEGLSPLPDGSNIGKYTDAI
ncbi:S-layer homology domain-containing protein [Candidatus Agathobaculum pullicola]|uniref:S-layer homology domain-containing protein n=1 Tax=Candidatus Agathobaculum pullicola TaxID=2838426 RepID=UPI003F932BE3